MRDINESSRSQINVTPHDSNPVLSNSDGRTVPFRGIYVGISGDVATIDEKGVSHVFVSVVAGVAQPIGGHVIKSTGTTATSIIALL